VRVKSAGVNPVDTYIRSGLHDVKPMLPYTPGMDGSGIIAEIGEQVTKFKVTFQSICIKLHMFSHYHIQLMLTGTS